MTSPNGSAASDVSLSELYQEVILDHNRRPRNFKKIEGASAVVHGVNPLCGDDFHLYLKKDAQGIIKEAGFEGQGCAISKSSASMMTSLIQNKDSKSVESLKDSFIRLLTTDNVTEEDKKNLGSLKIFEGVKNYPIRVKCATLIWRALEAALKTDSQKNEVSTE